MDEKELVYQLELLYLTKANIFDENNKPIWPNGIAKWPIRLHSKEEFDSVNSQLAQKKDVINIKKAGTKYGQQIQIRLKDILIAETNVYEPRPDSIVVGPDGKPLHDKLN